MDEYAGRVLAERYRLPLRPAGDDDFAETRAFDTYSGQEVLVRQVPLPEVVDAEVLDAEAAGPGLPGADGIAPVRARPVGAGAAADRSPRDPAVRRAWEAATAAAALPDHPGLDQVFDVFAQDGSLWIVGELVAARPLAAVLADRSLSPHRAAEIAADVLAALRALHAHGWLHRNITPRTVLVCDDGRAILTGLAVGAAQEALCGYAPVPGPAGLGGDGPVGNQDGPATSEPPSEGAAEATSTVTSTAEPTAKQTALSKGAPEAAADAAPEAEPDDPRRARAGAIAAYRAGARAAAVATESPDGPDDAPVPAPRPAARQVAHDGAWFSPYQDHIGNGSGNGKDRGDANGNANANANGAEAGAVAEPADEPEPEPAGSRPTTAPPTAYGRPSAGLAAERARQARLNVVGPVTERWAPEQAGPVHERWQLAPPVGRATDLWAVGVLLFRSVQGHPPYPEDSAAELAQLVCARQPAAAEECGALRPVVESLLRQDPAERPDFEVLCGWLRSLIRTAPEPELGSGVVTVPALERETDPRRLPIVRRRGELVRRGRHKKSRARRERHPAAAPPAAQAAAPVEPPPAPAMPPLQRLPKQPKPLRQPKPSRAAAPPKPVRLAKAPKRPTAPRAQREAAGGLYDQAYDQPYDQAYDPPYEQQLPGQVGVGPAPERGARAPRRPGAGGGPRHLGRLLLGLVLLLLVAAVVYAVMFLPGSGADTESGRKGDGSTGTSTGASGAASPAPSQGQDGGRDGSGNGGSAGTQDPQTTEPAGLDKGFVVRSDPKGFQVGVRKDWQRRGANDRGQVRYVGGDHELVIVPGRDTTAHFGADPMAYQQNKESELAPYRDSSWSSASGLRRIDVGKTAMAEGTFTWRDGSGREVYVRNLAMIHNGRYHLVLVIGPDNDRREIDHLYEQATDSYRPN